MTQVAPPPAPVIRRRRRKGGWLRDLLEVLLIALILYIIIWTALQTVRVDGTSMVGTLQNQDLLLASKISYDFGANPSRGDIAVLIPPSDPTRDFIKRIIGLPGDTIEINAGKVMIKPGGKGNWQVLHEPYLPQPWTTLDNCCDSAGKASGSAQPFTIPQDQYFVMGDNRNFSSDSRSFGPVPRKNILAKAFLRIWPINHFGGLGDGPTLATTGALAPAAGVALPGAGVALLELGRRRRRRLSR
ncbi:MAG TPA: signal peptidase I [Candidatus Dormibacteraeota bacterium]